MEGINTHFFTCKGIVPSKKNSRNQFYNKSLGRTINIPDKRYLSWEKTQKVLCRTMYGYRKDPIQECEKIVIEFYYPDKRRRDLTNGAESIMDMLVAAKILKDDNWEVTGPVFLYPFFDKEHPRCEVTIYEKKNKQLQLKIVERG